MYTLQLSPVLEEVKIELLAVFGLKMVPSASFCSFFDMCLVSSCSFEKNNFEFLAIFRCAIFPCVFW